MSHLVIIKLWLKCKNCDQTYSYTTSTTSTQTRGNLRNGRQKGERQQPTGTGMAGKLQAFEGIENQENLPEGCKIPTIIVLPFAIVHFQGVRATLALAPAKRLSTVQVSPLGDQQGYEDSIPLSLPKQPTSNQ